MDQAMRIIEDRLENWAFAVRVGVVRNHCASAEHRYRPPRDEDRRSPARIVDIADGWRVEYAWRELPARYRWLLKCHFVHSMARLGVIRWVTKRTGYVIKSWNFEAERHQAMRLLKKVLDMPLSSPENPRQQSEIHFDSKCVGTLSGVPARRDEDKPAPV